MNTQDKIIATKKAIAEDWLGRPGVTGMDVGFKYVGGKPTEDVAIRLFVRKKLAEVTPGERFPGLIGSHKTDVIECEFEAYDGHYHQLIREVKLSSRSKTKKTGIPVSVEFGGYEDDPYYLTLTYSELPTPPPAGWTKNIWNQSVSGRGFGGVPWTITNVYQTLTFSARAYYFNQPVFRWWINGQLVGDFNINVSDNVIVPAAVRTDIQLAPAYPIKLQQVELQFNAQGSAASDTAVLNINPTKAQGHIPITVMVDVCELSTYEYYATKVPPVQVPGFDLTWEIISATLDTQVLS